MLALDPETRPSTDNLCQSLADFVNLLGSRESTQILNEPTALIQSENLIGTDVFTHHGLLRWDEVLAPGHFEQHQRSIQRYNSLVSIRRKIFGRAHPNTVWSMSCFAHAHQFLRKKKYEEDAGREDRMVLNEVWEINKSLYGDEHPATISAQIALVSTYADAKIRSSEFREVLKVQQRILGKEHPETLKTMRLLGAALYGCDERHSGALIINDVLTTQKRVMGPKHVETLLTTVEFAYGERHLGRPMHALFLYRDLMTEFVNLFGPEHVDTLWCLYGQARAHLDQGECRSAIRLFKQVLPPTIRVFGHDHWMTKVFKTRLAIAYREMKRRSPVQ